MKLHSTLTQNSTFKVLALKLQLLSKEMDNQSFAKVILLTNAWRDSGLSFGRDR